MKKILSLICLMMLAMTSAWASEVATFDLGTKNGISTPEGFFKSVGEKWNWNSKFTGGEYDGKTFSNGLKMEGTTKIGFTTAFESTVTIVQSTWSANTIKLDDVELAVADAVEGTGCRIYTVSGVEAGDHVIGRGSGESGLFYIKVEWNALKTVTFINDANWETVYVYAWDADDKPVTEEWPGTQLTAGEDGNYTWSTTADPIGILFNNGTTQTTDQDFKDGGVYNSTGRIITLNDFTATFKTDGMDEVWAYVWNGEVKALGEWPGTKLEATDGVYTVAIEAEEAPKFIIFHNNAGDQTPDLAFEDGKAYEYMLNEYTATFTTDGGWETVNAYAWSGEKKFFGEWPGTALEATDGVYALSFKAFNAPENIIFNNGEAKTPDLEFINGRAYKWNTTLKPLFALEASEATIPAGTTVDVKDAAGDVVATLTYGVSGGAAFAAPSLRANDEYACFQYYTGGNGENGTADGGTVYYIKPVYDGSVTVGVWLNGNKSLFIQEDGTSLDGFDGYRRDYASGTAFTFDVKAGSTYAVYCTGSKLGFYGFDYTFDKPSTVEDYTNYILNADLTGEGGFDATGTKGIDGSGIVKVGNAAAFDFKQTIENLPAGQYKLTAQAAYRYGGDEQAEYDAIEGGTNTKLVQLYATFGSKTETKPVMNRYDGASETDYANGSGSVTVNGLFVPNSSSAVKAWFDNGQYVNELVFNLAADGDVTIGINRIGTPASDYTVIGPWTLTRLGDAEVEPEPETPEPGTDMTSYIVNPSFETGDLTGWTVGSSSDTGVKLGSSGSYATEGCDGDYLFNTWWQGIPITQTVKNLPLGKYELKALMTSDPGEHMYLLANGEHSEAFGAESNSVFVEQSMQFDVYDGTATIGAIGGNDDGSFNENGYFWYKVDNFRLTFVEAFDLAGLVASYEEALAAAQAVEGKMNKDVKAALDAAIAAEVDKTDVKALADAISALKEATADATASVEAYANATNVLPKMKELTESTNVYKQEAYEEYYGQWYQKYEADELTTAEASALQDPFMVTGWRASVTCDNFLLSAWDTNPDFNDAAYYINTWSTEGVEGSNNYAGKEYGVPFFEYWTGDANSLDERTLTGTMTDVPAGVYKVSAYVRVRGKNDFTLPAYGITMQANDGTAVNVVGDRLDETNFYFANVEVVGIVGEDGVLNIKFNIAGDNNISWLSFKNVVFEPYEITSYTVAGAFNTEEGGLDDVIFGKTWTPDLTDNDLVKGDDGVYTLTKKGVQLETGTIYYKVVADHSWNTLSWGFNGNNADYVVNEAGAYNITFFFNPDALLENGFNVHCVATTLPVGDVNCDGQVGIGDIVAITNVMAGIEKDPTIIARADVNGDGEVGIGDIVTITNIMAGVTETTEPETTE